MPTSEPRRKQLKRLLIKAAAIGAAALVTYLLLLFVAFEDGREMSAAMRDKLARLKALSSPKVIVVGGSNALFGIDSDRLQRSLGLPVVNMAMGAGVSLNYLLETVRAHLSRGDIIVLALEHAYFYSDPYAVTDSTMEVLFHDPDAVRYLETVKERISWGRLLGSLLTSNSRIIGYFDNRLRPLVPFLPQRIYRRESINALGDMVAHLGYPAGGVTAWRPEEPRPIDPDVVKLLLAFAVEARARGAQAVFSWPSVMSSLYRLDAQIIDATGDALRGTAAESRRSPRDYVFPDRYFYDTPWHLIAAGRALRTDKLLAEILESLAVDGGVPGPQLPDGIAPRGLRAARPGDTHHAPWPR